MNLALCILLISMIASLDLFSNAQQVFTNYGSVALQYHNTYRRRHQSPDLIMDRNLNSMAIRCAEYYASIRDIDHSCPYKMDTGENLLADAFGTDEDVVRMATNIWYDEGTKYDYNNPGFSFETGHFTELVWIDCIRLGFGIARDGNDNAYAVALYSPTGNNGFPSDFTQNVKPPITV